jgi:pimeloyl-ACP methyl ester carboxylesterase
MKIRILPLLLILSLLVTACIETAPEQATGTPAGVSDIPPSPTTSTLPEDLPTPLPRPLGTFEGMLVNNMGMETRVFINYIVDLPPGYEDATEPLPLMVILHGAGQEGMDRALIEPVGRTPALTASWERYPFIFLIPQLPAASVEWGQIGGIVDSLIMQTVEAYGVDQDRIYLMGYSKGGYGAITIGAVLPDRFAAVISLAGYYNGPISNLCPFAEANTPVLLYHGTADEIIPIGASEEINSALIDCGADVELIVIEDGTHLSTIQEAVLGLDMYDWALEHSR